MKQKTKLPAKIRHGRSQKARSPDLSSVEPSRHPYVFFGLIAAGIFLRILVFGSMGYFNNDNHLAVLEYVSRYWAPPHAAQFNQAYHPPLYYFLAAPLFLLGSLPAVQGLSLLSSVATLAIIAALLRHLSWIREKSKLWCLALAAFHPQFVIFSLFISNDTLAIFFGALIFYQCWRAQATASWGAYILLGVFLGLGLLTKAVFLVFVLPVMMFVWLTGRRFALERFQIGSRLAAVLCIATVLGCYKYLENFVLFGSPAINNLDFARWIAEQRPTWTGVGSLFDFNIVKLVRDPAISSSTVHSYPLMIYGSFWYAFVPESTFRSNLVAPFHRLGSLIYLAALWPTALMTIGAGRIGITALHAFRGVSHEENLSTSARRIFEVTLLLVLILNLLLIVSVGWNYDVWSVFQGRLLFPCYFAVLMALNAGMEWAESSRLRAVFTRSLLLSLVFLFLAYFVVEFWLASIYPANPLSMDHMPYKIDMNTP